MTELPLWASIPAAFLLVASGLAALTGSVGLLRLNQFYERMHAPTLGNTAGVAAVALASILVSSALQQRPIFHEIFIPLFLVITSPVTALLLMQASLHRRATPPAPDSAADSSEG